MRTQNLDFELVPRRVGVAYVSIRVNSQSTARSVVQEVLPLFGRQGEDQERFQLTEVLMSSRQGKWTAFLRS